MSLAASTWRSYVGNWERFTAWCASRSLDSLPSSPQTLVLYLEEMVASGRSLAAITVALAAIAHEHRRRLLSPPQAREPAHSAVRAIRARMADRRPVGSRALTSAQIASVVSALPGDFQGIHDRALLLLGFAGAFRCSELVALNIADVTLVGSGLSVRVRRSKTDQEGRGRDVQIPRSRDVAFCPEQAVRQWISTAPSTSVALFRLPQQPYRRLDRGGVTRILLKRMREAGLETIGYSSHSLRAGFATSAIMSGASFESVIQRTGHRTYGGAAHYVRPEGVSTFQCASCKTKMVWANIKLECPNEACLHGAPPMLPLHSF